MMSRDGGKYPDGFLVRGNELTGGTLNIGGYKHAMVQVISASIALGLPIEIPNAPRVADTLVLAEIINRSGGRATFERNRLQIDPRGMQDYCVPGDLGALVHGSMYLQPAYAVRFGKCVIGETGGCRIGSLSEGGRRPNKHILQVLEAFSYTTTPIGGILCTRETGKPDDVEIDINAFSDEPGFVSGPLVGGATKTAILCALSRKRTRIRNPYLKTDVKDLLRFVRKCGFDVAVSPDLIQIESPGRPLPDQPVIFELSGCVSEFITYVSFAVYTGSPVRIEGVDAPGIRSNLGPELQLLERMEVPLSWGPDAVHIPRLDRVSSVDIDVVPSGIQSDHHPFFALMLLKGNRKAVIREYVFRDRFAYVPGLAELGAEITRSGNAISISSSRTNKSGAILRGQDVRTAAVLLLGSLTVPGITYLEDVQHLYRGYDNLIPSLNSMGASIVPVSEEPQGWTEGKGLRALAKV